MYAIAQFSFHKGIIPALERAHGIAAVLKRAPQMRPDQLILANLSRRGDKDVAQAAEFLLGGKKQ